MLKGELLIQNRLSRDGREASRELLKRFDVDGSPIHVEGVKLTSKGLFPKKYYTPYGAVEVKRHVYQSSSGGPTYCPLEQRARIIQSATPKLANMLSHKYSRMTVDEVQSDLEYNHSLKLSRRYIQSVCEAVGAIAVAKEEDWDYSTPQMSRPVRTVCIGLDGTYMYLIKDGFRQAMVGTFALFDKDGERLHTTYVGASPEYGKAAFYARMLREVERVKQLYPRALNVGIADGAEENWLFLKKHTEIQITDFWHSTKYLTDASEVIFSKREEEEREYWLEERCHKLKHTHGAASRILNEVKSYSKKKYSAEKREKLKGAISYFTNQKQRMSYASYRERNLPIGSGVTEAACKTIVKQRLCRSGMKWKERGATVVISLRCLEKSGRWEQFWGKISQYGAVV